MRVYTLKIKYHPSSVTKGAQEKPYRFFSEFSYSITLKGKSNIPNAIQKIQKIQKIGLIQWCTSNDSVTRSCISSVHSTDIHDAQKVLSETMIP
jgi:hypothetical protein